MPRPPAVLNDAIVDANAHARAGAMIERSFPATELPRLQNAGITSPAPVSASFRFSLFAGEPAIDGVLQASVEAPCQRCLQPTPILLKESFQVLIVGEERADEPGGYEPVLADASRLDLRWLTEEQVLLALPLAPMHPEGACPTESSELPAEDVGDAVRQRPFQNLRDMLRER